MCFEVFVISSLITVFFGKPQSAILLQSKLLFFG